jgi:hypothetical protein
MCARQFVALHGRGRTRLKLDRFSAQRSSRPAVLLETEAMAFLRPLRAQLLSLLRIMTGLLMSTAPAST